MLPSFALAPPEAHASDSASDNPAPSVTEWLLHDDRVMRECFRHAAEIIKVATGASLALVTLIDRNHQHYRGEAGPAVRPIPRHNSLCEYAIRSGGVFVVEDTMLRPEVQECMLVQEAPHARFYAAVPIRLPDGEVVGALAALDPQPRRLEPRQWTRCATGRDDRERPEAAHRGRRRSAHAALQPPPDAGAHPPPVAGHARRRGLGAVMIDVDWFKQYNDAYGHSAGDACLRQVSALLREEAEKHQMVAGRVGGEEFALLVGAAQRPALGAVLESVRAGVERFAIAHRGSPYGRVTLSIGGSHTLRNGPCDRGIARPSWWRTGRCTGPRRRAEPGVDRVVVAQPTRQRLRPRLPPAAANYRQLPG